VFLCAKPIWDYPRINRGGKAGGSATDNVAIIEKSYLTQY